MYKLTAVVFTMLFARCVFAQVASADTSSFRQGMQAAVSSYFQFVKGDAEIYNGVEHPPYDYRMIGFAYYKLDEWQNASIEYQGILYNDVKAKYDLVRDQLIIRHPSGLGLGLFSPRVSWFMLGSDRFIYIQKDTNNTVPAAGFYQLLRTGALTAFAKRTKLIEEKIDGQELKREIEVVDRYYIVKDTVYYNIRNKSTLLAQMGEHRSEVKQSLRKARLHFRKSPEQALIMAVDIYNKDK